MWPKPSMRGSGPGRRGAFLPPVSEFIADALRALGIERAQGFLYGRQAPAAALAIERQRLPQSRLAKTA